MMKLASRIATVVAVLSLAAPAFATTSSQATTSPSPVAQPSSTHHRAHRKVASANEKKAAPKKGTKKSTAKNTPKTETPAAPTSAPTGK